ncbi:hypothetical protein BN946_scf185004.g29 [Trametes cinnabarina]|uniref:BTB domain-containing protein n=1 Tax=Pycnoporus cinnabarinus TaxID=5643 RepID=A0A060SRP8_PYCCI|nr:hypothetical protein BN946_scf185004.g29 [Trametes cinnabarina]
MSTMVNGHSGPSNGTVAAGDEYTNHTGPSASVDVPLTNGYAQPASLYQIHNDDIVNHLYYSGFQTGHVRTNIYRLHAIILSRSPYLAHLMSTSPQSGNQHIIYVNLDQELEVTDEGFHTALAYLYSAAALANVRPENARGVLAAACLLGRMDDLCNYAYEICRQSISLETLSSWLEFVEATPIPSDGSSTPVVSHPQHSRTAVYGLYAQRLRDDIFNFLVVTLPNLVNYGGQATPTTPLLEGTTQHADAGRETLLQVFARVPFDLFKAAIESPTFQLGSVHSRFKFAKDAIELRKQGIARGTGAEETVVLAFGGNNNSSGGVLVTRKTRKRQLWKVNSDLPYTDEVTGVTEAEEMCHLVHQASGRGDCHRQSRRPRLTFAAGPRLVDVQNNVEGKQAFASPLVCAGRGLVDAFRWDTVFRLVASDSEVRSNVLKSLMLNTVALVSIYFFDWLLLPLAQEQQKWFHRNLGWFYQVLWLLPVVGISFYLNSSWCTLIAKRTFTLQHGSRAVAQPPSTYSGMLNALATSAYRAVMVFTSVVLSFALAYIPYIGPVAAFVFLCWVDAYYCFEFIWIARGYSLARRVRHLEERWAYYFAFAALCMWGSSLANVALFALFFPAYIIMAMYARPLPIDPYNPALSVGSFAGTSHDSDDAVRYPSPLVPIRVPVFAPVIFLNDWIVRILSVGTSVGASTGSPQVLHSSQPRAPSLLLTVSVRASGDKCKAADQYRARRAGMTANTQDAIVLLGDSLTELGFNDNGFAAKLANAYVRKLDVVNRGFSGYNTDWIIPVFEQIVYDEIVTAIAEKYPEYHFDSLQPVFATLVTRCDALFSNPGNYLNITKKRSAFAK